MAKTILVLGAFDTKGEEFAHLRNLILEKGFDVLTVNTGVMGSTDLFRIDVPASAVAGAGGTGLAALRQKGDRGEAITVMANGAPKIAAKLYAEGKIDGIIGMGGSAGTTVATSAMRALPIAVPKVCVSTVASGETSHYVGIKDVVMIPSVVDVAGLNRISRKIYALAAGAVCGMTGMEMDDSADDRKIIAASMFGNTTECISMCREQLSELGREVLVFHATGVGGRTMESLVREEFVDGVLDITTTEWADQVCGGVFPAGTERLDAPGEKGVPHLIVPGCLDMCNWGAKETIPERYADRLFYVWNPSVTLMRTTPEENARLGEIFADKANAATGPVAVLIPLRGFSILDSIADGKPQPFWDPEADAAFTNSLLSKLDSEIEVVEMDANINDPDFAYQAVGMLNALMS